MSSSGMVPIWGADAQDKSPRARFRRREQLMQCFPACLFASRIAGRTGNLPVRWYRGCGFWHGRPRPAGAGPVPSGHWMLQNKSRLTHIGRRQLLGGPPPNPSLPMATQGFPFQPLACRTRDMGPRNSGTGLRIACFRLARFRTGGSRMSCRIAVRRRVLPSPGHAVAGMSDS